MVYIFGFFGFAMGFGVGLGVINVMLRNRSMNDIKKDSKAKWVYGPMVWVFAAIGGYLGVFIHNNYY
ncbi:MAG: hypothetical protein AAF549_06730 [Pseudomonadota bacterium]